MVRSERSTVLKFTAKCYCKNPEIYGKVFKTFIQDNRDQEGNVIDEEENEAQVIALREAFEEMGRKPLAVVIEKCLEYENFGGSSELMNFIDITKRFVMAVEKEPGRLIEFYSAWKKRNPMDINLVGMDNLTAAMITQYTHEYLEQVKSL